MRPHLANLDLKCLKKSVHDTEPKPINFQSTNIWMVVNLVLSGG